MRCFFRLMGKNKWRRDCSRDILYAPGSYRLCIKVPDKHRIEKLITFVKSIVMGLALTNSTIDKFFGFLSKLDNVSKKKLIVKLTESIEIKENKNFDLHSLSGAWEDSRSSDEINKDINNSRVNKTDLIDF